MEYLYWPSCNFPKFFPDTAPLVDDYMAKHYGAELMECCHFNASTFDMDKTAVTICMSCALMVRERGGEKTEVPIKELNIFELLCDDDSFPWPDLKGEKITLQDCFRAKDNRNIQDAVRKCLKRMNAEIVELPDNRENCRYDGRFLLRDASSDSKIHAPEYFSTVFPEHVTVMDEEEQLAYLKEYAEKITTDRVVCYCNTCTTGLKAAGKNAVHLAELMFGTK